MSKFVHLHNHSHYSLLDALPKVDELVKAAKKKGFTALAITDHGNMYAAIEFYEQCQKEGIKPIIGFEAYIAPESRLDKHVHDERPHHLVLLAQNYAGYKNLMKLASFGFTEGFHIYPRIDKELLRTHAASRCDVYSVRGDEKISNCSKTRPRNVVI
jgi:DNA polymerase-3 subunit alpha